MKRWTSEAVGSDMVGAILRVRGGPAQCRWRMMAKQQAPFIYYPDFKNSTDPPRRLADDTTGLASP